MRAESSDAPERITRKNRRRGMPNLLACLAVGSVVVVSAFLWASRSESHRRITSTEPEVRAVVTEANSGAVIRSTPASLSAEAFPADRQTSFNDQNFVPAGAHNIVTFHHSPGDSPRVEAPAKVKLTIVRQTPSMRDRACWPYRQGSIEARNCRLSVGLKHRD